MQELSNLHETLLKISILRIFVPTIEEKIRHDMIFMLLIIYNTLFQHFRDGLEGTSVNDANKVASAFPSFYIQDGLGALVYANLMSGWVNLDITK